MTKTHRLFSDVFLLVHRVLRKGLKAILLLTVTTFALAIAATYLLIALFVSFAS
jgi:hypothetical protein